MGTLYDTILDLCSRRGISGYRLCRDVGITPATLTDLKMGRRQGISARNADKIASYFGVSVGYLLGTEEAEAAPPAKITDAELKFALWGDSDEIDDADLEDVRRYAAFVKERKRAK